jgi:PKD repeat protein
VAAVPLFAVLAGAPGLSASRVDLSGGGAWLVSAGQGLATLIDGASEQVVGSVRAPGARAGDDLSAVQAGTSAYLVNASRGTVSRVDGGTYEVSAPVQFGTAGGPLGVLAGGPGVYVVDGSRRIASVIDPGSLRVRERLSLAAQPGPGQSVVDDAGRLWVVDSGGGGLTWFAGAKQVRPDVGDAAARLVLVAGQPVLVDVRRPRVGRLGADGGVPSWSCVDIRTGDRAELLGSSVAARVYAAVPATGTLVAAGVDRDDCALAVSVGSPGDEFGPLVEAGQFVLVPDRTTGRTAVVDIAGRQVVANLDVAEPGARLQLLVKDGLVFYNDLDGDRAGVIHFDGGQWRLGKALRKYNRSRTGEGILTPSGARAPAQPPADPPATPPGPAAPGQQNQPNPTGQPGRGEPADPGQPDPGQPGPTAPSRPTLAPTPPPQPPVIRGLTWNPVTVVREVPVTFTGAVDNALGASWTWSIIDPATGGTLQRDSTPRKLTVTLPAGTPANLQIKLEVSSPAGSARPVLEPFRTTSSLAPQIDSLTATTTDAGISQPLAFTGVESVARARGSWVWTVDGPGGPSGPIPGTAQQTLARTFDTAGDYTVTLTVSYDGASDRKSVLVHVADRARLTAVTASPVELRNGGAPSVQATLSGSFVAQAVGIRLASWLHASDFGGVTVQPDGTASFLVSVTGTAPVDGLNAGAITIFLAGNGNSVSFDVQANRAPHILPSGDGTMAEYTVCVGDAGNNRVQFLASYDDADLDTLVVTVRVAAATVTLVNGSQVPSLFAAYVDKSQLPASVSTWQVSATDKFGATSTVTVGTDQWNCW